MIHFMKQFLTVLQMVDVIAWLGELLIPSQTDVQKKALKILHLTNFSIVVISIGKSIEEL